MKKALEKNNTHVAPACSDPDLVEEHSGLYGLPDSWIPYAQLMRLDRPAGFYAFYFPYIIGLVYGACISDSHIPFTYLIRLSSFFIAWSIILRGASCTWNDNIDQDFDRAVTRCKNRPIARGAVSTFQGHIFTVFQVIIGALLLSFLPVNCTYDAIVISILFTIYPFGKRFTNYPQLILGFPFAGAIVMSCHALGLNPLSEKNGVATICLVLANVCWTMIYDTIYAHQDLKDDLKAGVKSMAVRFQDHTKPLLSVLAVSQSLLLIIVGLDLGLSALYFLISCVANGIFLAAAIVMVDLNKPSSCAWWFKMGFWMSGVSMAFGFLTDYLQRKL
jgi:4-hydroxybenzoate polyprenyltransferase